MDDMTPIPIVALDTPTKEAALALVDELADGCRFYKVGSELFTVVGPSIVHALVERGTEVFLDLKLHDIPNTVAGAVKAAAALGVRLLTVHAAGGEAMLRAAVNAAGDPARTAVLAVTVLTSLDATQLGSIWGRPSGLEMSEEVLRLAAVARDAGAYGVVCGGGEARDVKARFGSSLAILIPGIRPAGGATHDQARVVTPAEAAAAGARYVVVGRAVTAAADRRGAMRQIAAQLR